MTEEDMRALIVGLRYDAGDYGRFNAGVHDPREVLSWDRSQVRAWDAANLIESMLVRTSGGSGS